MTVKDLWIACNNWHHDNRVIIQIVQQSEHLEYDDIYEVLCLYDVIEVAMFWILEDGTIAIRLKV